MALCPSTQWETSKFIFNFPSQSEDWKVFYTRALDYLEAFNIDTNEADDWHTGWKKLKMMFEGEDRQTCQSLVDNGTITPESERTPQLALDAIVNTIKPASPMSANSLIRVSMPYLPVSLPSSPSVNFPTSKPRKC